MNVYRVSAHDGKRTQTHAVLARDIPHATESLLAIIEARTGSSQGVTVRNVLLVAEDVVVDVREKVGVTINGSNAGKLDLGGTS